MYDAYLTAAAKRPYILGYCRCQYVSAFREDRGLLKQGLLDERGVPYAEIVSRFAETNRRVLKIRDSMVKSKLSDINQSQRVRKFRSLMSSVDLEVGQSKEVILSDGHAVTASQRDPREIPTANSRGTIQPWPITRQRSRRDSRSAT